MAKLKTKELSSTLATFFLFISLLVLDVTLCHVCSEFSVGLVFVRRAGQWRLSAIMPTAHHDRRWFLLEYCCLFIDV